MDFRHPIVTCLFSMLRLSFETQKVKENYAIFLKKSGHFCIKSGPFTGRKPATNSSKYNSCCLVNNFLAE